MSSEEPPIPPPATFTPRRRSLRSRRFLVALAVLVVAAASCGGGGGTGDVDGEALFAQTVTAGQPGCVTCHSRAEGVTIIGPSLAGIAGRAADRQPGVSAEEYLRTSIVDPDAYLVDGFPSGRMPAVWGEVLTEEQIDALVGYLLTLD